MQTHLDIPGDSQSEWPNKQHTQIQHTLYPPKMSTSVYGVRTKGHAAYTNLCTFDESPPPTPSKPVLAPHCYSVQCKSSWDAAYVCVYMCVYLVM